MKYSVMLISLPTTDYNNEFINFPCYHWSLEQPVFKTLFCSFTVHAYFGHRIKVTMFELKLILENESYAII